MISKGAREPVDELRFDSSERDVLKGGGGKAICNRMRQHGAPYAPALHEIPP